MGKNCDWCIHRKRMSFSSQVHCQGWLHSFEQNISLLEKEDYFFLMEFFPLAFWPNEFPTAGAPLALLWMPTVSYLCHILPCEAADLFGARVVTCIMNEHPGVWHVRIEPWTPYGHSFWPDCWPWGTSFVFLYHQDQRQSSSSSLSPRAPFSSIALLVSEIFPPMMYHPLPCSWATAVPMGVSFYLLSLLILGSVSQLYFPINIELMSWSIMLEERGDWAGEGHQGAEFEIPTLVALPEHRKTERQVPIWRDTIKFSGLCSSRKLIAEKEEKWTLPF